MAQKNGATNVDEMLDAMSATQFVEWQQFSYLEPFGAKVEEIHLAALRAHIANYFKSKDSKSYSINDFMLSAVEKLSQREKSAEEIYKLFG